ncbi:hypothetical protein V1L52_03785 [Treponema sp. HNW]|uniref:hypothetical protein n=1 Tax=Treponema sp. HNW TaxID=3116654 RepID=UPI003D106274
MDTFRRICFFTALFAAAVLIFGTAIAFVSGKAEPGTALRKKDPSPEVLEKKIQPGEAVFSHVGTIRCSTSDTPPVPLVITPYFRYSAEDRAFYEELTQKVRKIRLIIGEYTEQYTRAELLRRGEEKIKNDLTDLINRELVLGKIENLYFSEYIFFE